MANYYNNLTSSGLTLAKNGLTTSSADTVLLNDKATFNKNDFELFGIVGPFPKWSEVATATTGDIVIPDCIVDVTSFNTKYRLSAIISFKTGSLLGCNRVTNMTGMFDICSSLTSLDVSNFDTSQVTTMSSMFHSCSSLTSLDVSNFDTSQVTTMSSMFDNCSSLTSLNVSSFDTSNVTNMSSMFSGCSSLTSLNVSSFDTSQVTTMNSMFSGCSSLTSLDLSSFDTSKVQYIDMRFMFDMCSSLTSLTLSSNWGRKLTNPASTKYRTLDLSTTAITKDCANDVLSKLADVSKLSFRPIIIFKSSLGLSASEIAVGTNKGWDVQVV